MKCNICEFTKKFPSRKNYMISDQKILRRCLDLGRITKGEVQEIVWNNVYNGDMQKSLEIFRETMKKLI